MIDVDIIPQQYRWLCWALLAALIFGSGWRLGSELKQAEWDQQRLSDTERAFADYQKAVVRGNKLAKELAEEKANIKVEFHTIKEKVPYVVEKYIPSPGANAVPIPACVYTRGFVGLWNDAQDGKLSVATGGTDGATAEANSAEALAPSGVTSADILRNHIDNAEQDIAIRRQCEKLIQWHTGDEQNGQ